MELRPISARLALTLVVTDSVASLARCFTGSEVLPVLLVTVVPVSLALGLGSGIASFEHRSGSQAARRAGPAGEVAVVLVGVCVPLWWLFGATTRSGIPTEATWRALHEAAYRAITAFRLLEAPVPEYRGLVLAACLAGLVVALVTEGLASLPGLPPAVAVLPATALLLFSSAVAPPAGEWLATASFAGVSVLYLVAVGPYRRDIEVVARSGDESGTVAGNRDVARRALGLAVLSGLAVLLLGPLVPGAGSAALLSLHSRDESASARLGLADSRAGALVASGVSAGGRVTESALVQVAETKVGANRRVALFEVETPRPTYYITTTLDAFNGNLWYASRQSSPHGLPALSERTAPRLSTATNTSFLEVTQIFSDLALGGTSLPAAFLPVGFGSPELSARLDTTSGALQAERPLAFGDRYTVRSRIVDLRRALRSASSASRRGSVPGALYTSLPRHIPEVLIRLAHRLVHRARTRAGEALALEAYFQSGRFSYALPRVAPSGRLVTGGEGLADLVAFLDVSRTGYCQQFSSAFAVLARIDGLPTRVAVGFLPGRRIARDRYLVTGADAHAWDQVYLSSSAGWVSFDPTPGRVVPALGGPPLLGVAPQLAPGSRTGATGVLGHHAPNLRELPPAFDTAGPAALAIGSAGSDASAGSGLARRLGTGLALAGLAALLAFLVVMPRLRSRRSRRQRSSPLEEMTFSWQAAVEPLRWRDLEHRSGETCLAYATRVRASGVLGPRESRQLLSLAEELTAATCRPDPPALERLRRFSAEAYSVRKAGLALLGWRLRLAELRGPGSARATRATSRRAPSLLSLLLSREREARRRGPGAGGSA